MGGERGEKTVYVAKVEVSRPKNVIYVRLIGLCAVKDDPQTLNLQVGED